MSKIIDITNKLNFEEKPIIKVKDVEVEANNDAVTMLKVMALFDSDGKAVEFKNILTIYDLLFDKANQKKIEKLKLTFKDFATFITESAALLVNGEEEPEGGNDDPGYDLIDDFDLIVSSFKSSYGVSVYSKEFQEMTWTEFRSLLQGLGAESPLARTAQIRLENDKDILKNFTSSQHRIRNTWRSRNVKKYTEADMKKVLASFQEAFASL